MAGVKVNFAYNLVLTVGNYIIPLLTFPYITRVLGVENMGLCNYIDSIINYYVLFSALGVSGIGVREIASTKNDPSRMSKAYSTLLFMNLALSLVAVVVLVASLFYFPSLQSSRYYLYIGISKILSSVFLIEWFFQGISNFKFITARSLGVRFVYVVLVFALVKSPEDTLLYFALTNLVFVINAIINILYSRRFVRFSFREIRFAHYWFPVLSFGIYKILTSMYTSFNVVYLGSICGNVQVGYFTTATKLYAIFLSLFTAFTTVMIPKISEMLQEKRYSELQVIARKTFDMIFSVTLPIIIVSCSFAPLIIHIIAGDGYEGAIDTFRIVMLLLLVIGLEQIVIQQFLMAVKESKCILLLSSIGAVVGIAMNILLVEHYQSIGSAVSWTIAEISILLVSLIFLKRYFNITLPLFSLLRYLLISTPYLLICLFVCDNTLSVTNLIALAVMLGWFIFSNTKILPNPVLSTFRHE